MGRYYLKYNLTYFDINSIIYSFSSRLLININKLLISNVYNTLQFSGIVLKKMWYLFASIILSFISITLIKS